jgi:hypothetical protein
MTVKFTAMETEAGEARGQDSLTPEKKRREG